MKLIKNKKVILVLIILLAAFLRLIALDKIPPSLHHDEILSGFEAYSILETGQDQWGNSFPLRFKAFGDYVPPLYFYFNVPFVLILGLKDWVIRLPAAILGILAVIFTFFLTIELFKNKNIALLATLLMAISPWHLLYSRLGWPASMLPALITLGLWLFFAGLNKKTNLKIYLGIFFLCLSTWAYTPAQAFIPLLLLGLFFLYKKELSKKSIIIIFLVAIVVLLPLYTLSLIHPEWNTRFNSISIFNMPKWISGGESQDYLISLLSPLIVAITFWANYFLHLNPVFLFIKGDNNLRHSLLGMGQLYLFEMFFWFFLIIYLRFKKEKIAHGKFLLYWLLIYPVSSSFTFETPHASRTIVALPLVHIISALGIFFFLKFIRDKIQEKRILILNYLVIALIIVISFSFLLINYYKFYPVYAAPKFDYGQKELVKYIDENYDQYEKIIFLSNQVQPYMNLMLYRPFDIKKFQQEVKVEDIEGGIIVRSFDKFEFLFKFQEKNYEFSPRVLYVEEVDQKNDQPLPLKTKKIIYFPDGSPAYRFSILE